MNQFSDRSAALAGFCGPNRLWVGVGLTHSRTVSVTVLSVAAGRTMLRFFLLISVGFRAEGGVGIPSETRNTH